jgi:hypothetical protein
MRRRTSPLTAVALLVAGCTSNDEHRLYGEVGHLVPYALANGQTETMAEAERALHRAGFDCGPTASVQLPPKMRECSRHKNYAVLATCIQRVDLMPKPDGVFLSYYYVPRILCAGL